MGDELPTSELIKEVGDQGINARSNLEQIFKTCHTFYAVVMIRFSQHNYFSICQVCITMEILGKVDYGTPGALLTM